MLQLEKEKFEV